MSNFAVKPGSWKQTSSRFQTGIKDYTLADRVTAKELVVTDRSGGSNASGTGEFDWVRIGNLTDLSAGGPSPSGQAEIQLSVSGETLNGAGTVYVWEGVPGNTLTPLGITEVLDPGTNVYFRFGAAVGAQLRETRLFACGVDNVGGSRDYPMGITFAVDPSGIASSGTNYYLPDNTGNVGGGFALPNNTPSEISAYPKGYLWAYDASFGNVVGDQFTSRSDVSLKESVTTISDGLEIVNQLRPVRYTRKADGVKEVGFIAQEVHDHLPEVVVEGSPMGVKYPNITAVLVNAVQSLSAEVNALKEEIADLRANASNPPC